MNPICKQCGKVEVEDARTHYATPVCFACLPPPKPLNTEWSLLEAIRDTREERDKLKRELGGLCVSVRAANDSMEKMERDLYLKMQVVEDDRDDWKLKAEQPESPAMRELREMVAMPDGEASAVLAAVVDTVARLREALETIRYEASGLIAKAGSPRYDPRVEYGATDSLYDDGHEDGVVAAAGKLRTIAEYAIAPYLAKDGKIAFDPQAESIRRRPDQEPR